MISSDGSKVLKIYKMGIESGIATFETNVPSWEEWDAKHHKHSRFVYQLDDTITGWIALAPTSSRFAYRGVAEVSVYISQNCQRKGYGSALMQKMIQSSEKEGIWTLTSSVFPENLATYNLHQKFGFRLVGYREKIAKLNGQWRDTIILERRSTII